MIIAAEMTARMKEEIFADVLAGVVPADISSFSDLHEHVDANTYTLEQKNSSAKS